MISDGPVSAVLAGKDIRKCAYVKDIICSDKLRIQTTTDVKGVCIGGALKNPIAILTGVVRGMGFSQSVIASVVTKGFKDIMKMAESLGGCEYDTLHGLSGIGDLMLTCYSSLSRNTRFGERIGRGECIQSILDDLGEVVEGGATCKEVVTLASKYGLILPTFNAVHEILNKHNCVKESLYTLLNS